VTDIPHRPATPDEEASYFDGTRAIEGAVETEHGLVVPDPIVVRGSDQDKAQWRCRFSDELTMIGHHGTVADLEAAVRKEIGLYRLDINPDAVDYAALSRFIVEEGLFGMSLADALENVRRNEEATSD
jgi:hypothetical protein